MNFELSDKARDYQQRVRTFIDERIRPVEDKMLAERRDNVMESPDWTTWTVNPEVDRLKSEAKEAGLWNMFLHNLEDGPGLKNVEYAVIAEETGRSVLAAEVFNCSAPDTGNMEVLHMYGSDEQKERWLKPLLAGEIRSAFCMTEPDVASSDATNMAATAVVEGDEVVLNGKKWWSSGIGHPNCKVIIFMALTDPDADRHSQHSMVLVPMDTPGITIKRMLPVFGEYDAPHGHGEVWFDNVRLPESAIIAGPGRGFEIAQGRLGPGRIHHCMRCIGASEAALQMAIERGMQRVAFGKPLINLGGNRERVAEMRIAIDQARLLTLYAAWKIDQSSALSALTEISAIKVVAPNVLQTVADFAIQIHGGGGTSRDFPLTALFAMGRALRLADGPDEVHKGVITRVELMKYSHLKK